MAKVLFLLLAVLVAVSAVKIFIKKKLGDELTQTFRDKGEALSRDSRFLNESEGQRCRLRQYLTQTGEDAKAFILSEFPHLKIYILRDGSPVTMDYRFDRVRIFVDEQGVVVRTPHIA
ncbi:hypothetical protein HELRODRAFT_165184 [Helobdella robusta]|uniref:Uncharacterized protein n=1 Tax=Helobdella robusta TaxID=6412 RepID=T1EWE4_HELRO|nr:hypothetical protein HELRODRAFT_165184 [Helobdella robusta]ESN93028.1 hypothetical protein HELRODRAFT_165184 [Helobdella robusta]